VCALTGNMRDTAHTEGEKTRCFEAEFRHGFGAMSASESVEQLSAELLILSRLLHRNHGQHRRSRWFSHLQRCRALAERCSAGKVLKQGDRLIAAKFKSLNDAAELKSVVDACVGLRTELDGMLRLMDCSRKTWELVLCYIKRKEFVPLMTVMSALAARVFRCAAVLALALHGAWAAVASKTKLLPEATQEVLTGYFTSSKEESGLFYQLPPIVTCLHLHLFQSLHRPW